MSTTVTIPGKGLTDEELDALIGPRAEPGSTSDKGLTDAELDALFSKTESPEPRYRMASLPPKSGLGKVKDFFLGDPLTGETLPGQVISTMAGDRSLPLDLDAPFVKPEAAIQRPEGAVENVSHGTLKALGEFTSTANIMMLGGIAGAMGVVGKFGLTGVQRLISAGFSADMIHALVGRAPELKAASEEKQDDEFWHIVGEMLPVGAMALGAGAHAARPGAKGAAKPEAKPVEKPAPPPGAVVPEAKPAAPKPAVVAPKPPIPEPRPTPGEPAPPVVEVPPAVPRPKPAVTEAPPPAPVVAPKPAPVAAPKPVEVPAAVAEAKPIEGPAGKETVLHTPSSEVRAVYRLVEADTLQPSHNAFTFEKNPQYPKGVQERTYHSSKNAQAEVIRQGDDYKGEFVVNTDPTAINGPAQMTPSGIVVGGNNRVMAAQRAYANNRAGNYRKYLEENIEEFGLKREQAASMEKPVLVREILDGPRDAEGLRVLGSELNKDFKKGLSEIEEAVSAGKSLSTETANKIALEFEGLGETGTLRALMDKDPTLFRDALLKDNVLKESDLPKYFTELGTMNGAGKNFVENSLVGAAIRDADLMQSLPRELLVKFERLVPQMIELGNRSDSWNIMGDVREAARQVTSAQVRGIKLADQLGQRDMFGGGVSQEVAAIARTLATKPTEVSKAFKQYVADARTDVPGQATMFGKADRAESFGRIFGLEQTAAAPAATGTYAMASSTRPTLPSVARATMPKELVRKSEIIADLSKALNLPIRVGRFREKALGIYKPKAEVVRTKEALDIPVVAHEVGHHINKVLYGGPGGKLNWEPLKAFKDELEPIATKPRKGQSPLPEGFAEFVRLVLTRPGEAIDKAPRFHAEFQKQLAGQPELQAVLLNAREQIKRYTEQPAAAKVLAHISKEEVPVPAKTFARHYTQFMDALHPIKKAVDEMAQRKGNQPPTEENAYSLARLFAGWSGKADHFINQGTFAPGKTLEVTGKGLKEILKPVDGKLDDLRIYLVARRALEKGGQDIKTGISAKDARDALKEVETPALKKVAEDIYSYNDQLLQYLVKSEFMTPEQYTVIKKMNQNYVPFYRVMESGGGVGSGGKSFGDLWNPVSRMKGSTREIVDPLESIFKNTHTLINVAEKHRVGLSLVRQAAKTEGGGQWVERVPAKMRPTQFSLGEIKKVLEEAGVDVKAIPKEDLEAVATVFRPNVKGSVQENTISVFENGKSELYQIQPDLYKVVKGMESQDTNVLIDILSKPAKLLRLGATGVGPEFLFRNPLRDTWTAYIQSRNGFVPGVDNFRGLFHVLKKDDLFHEWQRAGGEHAAMVSMDRKALVGNLKDMVASPMKLRARHPIETARMLSELLEASTRIGEYGKARAKGKSAQEAALDSREVTLDFARIGSMTREVNKISAFWNAQVQGTDKFVRSHMENPKGTVAKATASITLPSLLMYAINKDDPEYQDLPRWQKDFFWMVPTKGIPDLYEKTSFIPIPKPFLWGMVYGTSVERAAEWINEKDPKAFDGFVNSMTQVALPNPSPTAANIAYELWANKSSFTGRDIVPKYMQRIPPQHQFEPWTTAFSKRTAEMFKHADIEVSPIKLDHLMFGLTAGGGRAVAAAAEPIFRKEGEEAPEKTMADIPGVRAFAIRKGGGGESMQRFYDRFEELDAKFNATRFAKRYKGRGIEAEPLTAGEKKEYGLLRKARSRAGKISGAIRKSTEQEKTDGAPHETEKLLPRDHGAGRQDT